MRFQFPIFRTIVVTTFLIVGLVPQVCFGQIREVRRYLLNDIGAARTDRAGNGYVEINPIRCRQLGPALCEFFRQHEYGHLNLNHFGRRISTRRAEAEADCYAAKAVSPSIANAAINYFQSGFGSSRVHGSSQQRAARVSNCSKANSQSVAKRTPLRKIIPTKRRASGATRTTNVKRIARPIMIIRPTAKTRPTVRSTQPPKLFSRLRTRTRPTTIRPVRNIRSVPFTSSTRVIRPTQTIVYRSR